MSDRTKTDDVSGRRKLAALPERMEVEMENNLDSQHEKKGNPEETLKHQVKSAFAHLNPTDDQKKQMLQEIAGKSNKKYRRPLKAGAAAAVIVVCAVLSCVGIDAATGGKAVNALREFCGFQSDADEIVANTEQIRIKGVEVYAPEIFALDERKLVFGSQGGILIYDRQKERLSAMIDVQEIGCVYFNSDKKKTHVLKKDDAVYIFNTDAGEVFGNYYCFALNQENGGLLAVSESGDDKNILKKLYQEWKENEKQYTDTFEEFQNEDFIQNDGKDDTMYSERSYQWKSKDGKGYVSCLLVDKNSRYVLYTAELTPLSSEVPVQKEVLNLRQTTDGETKANVNDADASLEDDEMNADENVRQDQLPEFQYTGEDPIEKAIYAYLKKDDSYWMPEEGGVQIPMLYILARKRHGEEMRIFAFYMINGYVRTGQMLENVSGGSQVACFHLEKSGTEYLVTKINRVKEGGEYEPSLKRMTSEYSGLYGKLKKRLDEFSDEKEQQWICSHIADYVKKNNLDIKYYKEYGWDPVLIEKKD